MFIRTAVYPISVEMQLAHQNVHFTTELKPLMPEITKLLHLSLPNFGFWVTNIKANLRFERNAFNAILSRDRRNELTT